MTDTSLNIKQTQEQVGVGTIVLSVDSSHKSPSVTIKSTGITITSNNPGIGINVDDSGISFQGTISFMSSGVSMSKGNYTENPNSNAPYTSTETVFVQSAIQTALYEQLASQGIDTSSFKGGLAPIVTDIAGVPPHVHTISLKHTHAVQPAYLYKMSPLLNGMKGALSSFQSFLSA